MTLVTHLTLNEDTGSTAYDYSGNGNNGTVSGPTLGATGILGSSAYSFNGTSDTIDGLSDNGVPLSFSFWAYPEDVSNTRTVMSFAYNYPDGGYLVRFTNGELEIYAPAGNKPTVSATANEWQFWVFTVDSNDNARVYKNGKKVVEQNSPSGTLGSGIRLGGESSDQFYFKGRLSNVRIYDHVLTDAEVQYLYDVGTSGSVLTDVQSYGSSISPNLRADITLNGQSATASVTGSPETANEETVTQDLSDGVNDYTLSWSNTHTDFRIEIDTTLNVVDRVEVNSVSLL